MSYSTCWNLRRRNISRTMVALMRYSQHVEIRHAAHKFERIYTSAPATNYALVSLLTSIYPEVTSESMTKKYPGLSIRLYRERSFCTRVQNRILPFLRCSLPVSDIFLASKGFDIVEDYRDRICETGVFRNSSQRWQYMDLTSDLCTVKSMTDWIELKPNEPFFTVMWTGMTHHPYFTEGEVKRYVSDPSLNRYLNALRTADEAFGTLMRYLEARKQQDQHWLSFWAIMAKLSDNTVPMFTLAPYLKRCPYSFVVMANLQNLPTTAARR